MSEQSCGGGLKSGVVALVLVLGPMSFASEVDFRSSVVSSQLDDSTVAVTLLIDDIEITVAPSEGKLNQTTDGFELMR